MLGVTCQQFNIDCSTVGNQFDCQLDCLNATPCQNLNFATIQACNTMCMGGPMDGGPPPMDGGMMGGDCQGCAIQQCQIAAFTCAQNQACMGWLGCVGQCQEAMPPDPACAAACDAQFPSAKPMYDALYSCTCQNCSTACSALDPCSHMP